MESGEGNSTTASNFGDICMMRKSTSCAVKVRNILYNKFLGNKNTRYGIENEYLAIRQFECQLNLKVLYNKLLLFEQVRIHISYY
jgi:hypothetical protein